jgi:hypothetical protein
MATQTFTASANSGGLQSRSTVYATARAGTGSTTATLAADARIGQRLFFSEYYIWQYLLEFDLTALAGATITAATLSIYPWAIDGTGYGLEARSYDYGTLATSDFVAGASLSGLTLLGSYTATAPDSVYKAFSDVALTSTLVEGALNRMVVNPVNQRTDTAPTVDEYVTAYFDNSAGQPPKIDITYTPPAAPTGNNSLGALGVGS